MPYFVYILQNESSSFYVGQTNKLEERFQRHNDNRVKATKGKGPWKLLHWEQFATRAEAMNRERDIKNRKSRDYINSLVRTSRA